MRQGLPIAPHKTNVRAILCGLEAPMHDDINPRFVYFSSVHFDELDPMKMLHNSRFAAHVERAVSAWYTALGGSWRLDPRENPDQFHVVRDLHIEYLNPVVGPGTMRVDVWIER